MIILFYLLESLTSFGTFKVFERTSDQAELIDVEKTAMNKWRWEWLEVSVTIDPAEVHSSLKWDKGPITIFIKDHICKINLTGFALCQTCSSTLEYNKEGLKGLRNHLKTKKHLEHLISQYSESKNDIESPHSVAAPTMEMVSEYHI